jgi:hypothetical protein
MRWLSLFLTYQHLYSGTNLRECEDQSWFKVQAVPVFRFDWYKMFSHTPLRCLRELGGTRTPGWRPLIYKYSALFTTGLDATRHSRVCPISCLMTKWMIIGLSCGLVYSSVRVCQWMYICRLLARLLSATHCLHANFISSQCVPYLSNGTNRKSIKLNLFIFGIYL